MKQKLLLVASGLLIGIFIGLGIASQVTLGQASLGDVLNGRR